MKKWFSKILPFAALLLSGLITSYQTAAEQPAAVANSTLPQILDVKEGPVDVRVIVDMSGSMKQNDPNNLRVPALELLIEMLPEGSRAGIWTFGKWVNMLVPPGEVNDAWRNNAKQKAGRINSHGLRTNMGEALEKAMWQLDQESGFHQSAILLTDGMVDIAPSSDPKQAEKNAQERERIIKEIIPKYQASGTEIHTIALSDKADMGLLEQMAVGTEGLASVANSADDLIKIFLRTFDQAVPTEQVPLTPVEKTPPDAKAADQATAGETQDAQAAQPTQPGEAVSEAAQADKEGTSTEEQAGTDAATSTDEKIEITDSKDAITDPSKVQDQAQIEEQKSAEPAQEPAQETGQESAQETGQEEQEEDGPRSQFKVDSAIREFTALIFFPKGGAKPKLIAPDGKVLEEQNPQTGVRWYSKENFSLITVSDPSAGNWMIEGEMDPNNRITVVSDVKLKIDGIPTNISPGEKIDMEVYLHEEGKKVTRKEFLSLMDVDLKVTMQSGKSGKKRISSAETPPTDGVFREKLHKLREQGTYELEVLLEGKTFQRSKKIYMTMRDPISVEYSASGSEHYLLKVIPNSQTIDKSQTRVIAKIKGPDQDSIIQAVRLNEEGFWEAKVRPTKGEGSYEVSLNIKVISTTGRESRQKPPKKDLVFPIPEDFNTQENQQRNQSLAEAKEKPAETAEDPGTEDPAAEEQAEAAKDEGEKEETAEAAAPEEEAT